jgi:hypothetical protein
MNFESLEAPTPTGFAQIVSDDFPVLHGFNIQMPSFNQ